MALALLLDLRLVLILTSVVGAQGGADSALSGSTIIIEKQTVPDGAPNLFTFTGDASGSIGDGGQIVVDVPLAGTYTSQEKVPARWELTGIACDDTDSGGDLSAGTAAFHVVDIEEIR